MDWSNDNGSGDNAPTTYNAPAPVNGQLDQGPVPQSTLLPALPPGADLPPNLTCPDAISRTLSTLPAPQLLDILSQMKGLVTTDSAKATELLKQAPQLAYAIFQSLLLLNLVDPSVLGSLVDAPAAAAAPPPQVNPALAAPQPPRPPQSYPGYPPQPVPTPPQVVPQPYAQPPPPQQPPAMDAQQQAYAQILRMTPQQIEQLAPDVRQQIMQIRSMLMAGQR